MHFVLHLYWYVSNNIILHLYVKCFFDTEHSYATKTYGDGRFVGDPLVHMKNESEKYRSVCREWIISVFSISLSDVLWGGVATHNKTN